MEVVLIDKSGKEKGKVSFPSVLRASPQEGLLHFMVRYQQARKRAGTHQVKDRGEVSGTTRKAFKQKGTGSARRGSNRVSQFRGGGKVFGARSRSHAIGMPKKMRTLALKMALSLKAKDKNFVVVEDAVVSLKTVSSLKAELRAFSPAMYIVHGHSHRDFTALRNLHKVDLVPAVGANVYGILKRSWLVVTRSALKELEERLQ